MHAPGATTDRDRHDVGLLAVPKDLMISDRACSVITAATGLSPFAGLPA
jgi:hypothetical protein